MQGFIWGITSFIFYKVAYDSAFDDDISIIAALMLGLLTVGIVQVFSAITAQQYVFHNRIAQFQGDSQPHFSVSFIFLIIMIAINFLFSRLIIFGFSKELNNDIDLYNYRGITEDFWYILLICSAFPLLHFISMKISVKLDQQNRTDYLHPDMEREIQSLNTPKIEQPALPRGMTKFDLEVIERAMIIVAGIDNDFTDAESLLMFVFLREKICLDIEPEYVFMKYNLYVRQGAYNISRIEELNGWATEYYQQLAFKGAALMALANANKVTDTTTSTDEMILLQPIAEALRLNSNQAISLLNEVGNFLNKT